jgi:hypothetical protein
MLTSADNTKEFFKKIITIFLTFIRGLGGLVKKIVHKSHATVSSRIKIFTKCCKNNAKKSIFSCYY